MTNAIRRLAAVGLATLLMTGAALAATPEEEATAAAQEWAKAVMTRDVETEVKMLPATMFPKPGDRERRRLVRTAEREAAIIAGEKYLAYDVRPPLQTVQINKYTAIVFPYATKIDTPRGRLLTSSSLIALSEDGGKWSIIDGNGQTTRSLKQLIPGYTGGLSLPVSKVVLVKPE